MYATIYTLGNLTDETIDEVRVDVRTAETMLGTYAQGCADDGESLNHADLTDEVMETGTHAKVHFVLQNLTRHNQIVMVGCHAYVLPFRAFNPYDHA